MATKQDILNSLATFDKSTLDKLLTFGEVLLIPEPDLLINVTQVQMIDKAHTLADQFFPTWTDRSKSDFGEFLVELMALFSEKDFWYINAFANEGLLHKMAVYSNAYYRAIELGYHPYPFTSATTKVSLTFDPGTEFILEIGDVILDRQGSDVVLSNVERVIVEASGASLTKVVDFAHGVYETTSQNFNGKSFKIGTPKIDITSLEVSDPQVAWTHVESFAEVSATDKVFLTIPEEDGRVDIVFGNNIFGYLPEPSTVLTAKYRKGGGSEGNYDVIGVYTVQQIPPGRAVTTVLELLPLSGGQDQEALVSIQANAPLQFRTKGRILNPLDCIDLLVQRDDVRKAFAYNWTTSLIFYVIPEDGNIATQAFLSELSDFVGEILVMGFSPASSNTTYIDLANLDITAFCLQGFNLAEKEIELRELIEEYTDPMRRAEYAGSFVFSVFVAYLVASVEGLTNVIINEVQSLPAAGFGSQVDVFGGQILKGLDGTGAATITTTPTSHKVAQGEIIIEVKFL
jgi:hypothetical protein